jgi:stage II sporulation protein AA (anti-sigma F factor antagonist)
VQLQIREEEGAIFVKIFGELDLKIVDELRLELDEIINGSDKKLLILDFTGVDFIDSSGLGVILGRYKRFKIREGKIIIINPNANVKRVLELSGIMNVIEVRDSLDYIG